MFLCAQLVSKEVYSELSRFDPIGAGFMLSLDDDGYFTVSSDPRVRQPPRYYMIIFDIHVHRYFTLCLDVCS